VTQSGDQTAGSESGLEEPGSGTSGIYVPAGPEKAGERFARYWASVTVGTRAFIGWSGGFVVVGAGLFWCVTYKACAATAFEVLTQRKSPVNSGLGTAGWALSIFGYFIAPAIVAAVVSGLYMTNSGMSGRKKAKSDAKIARAASGQPGKLRRFWNSLTANGGA